MNHQPKCPTCGRRLPAPQSKDSLTVTQREIVDRLNRGESLYWRPGGKPDMVRIPPPQPATIQRMIDLGLVNPPNPEHDYEITVAPHK